MRHPVATASAALSSALPIREGAGFIIVLEVLRLTHTYGGRTADELVGIVGGWQR
jgi:hypothetical protein